VPAAPVTDGEVEAIGERATPGTDKERMAVGHVVDFLIAKDVQHAHPTSRGDQSDYRLQGVVEHTDAKGESLMVIAVRAMNVNA
jgi:hypothetical protein